MATKKVTTNTTSSSTTSGKRQVNWTLTLIMSILFGSLGVDRFIMGHIGLGILKLITLGGCGIWWLIDLILIAIKHPFEGIEWVQN
jgi:TM2 domain-containing membrane protein YozV